MATWGRTAAGGSGISIQQRIIATSGQFNVAGQKLDSVHLYILSATVGGDVRVAVYTAATSEPNGATLVEDLGVVTVDAADDGVWKTWTSATNPSLTNGDYLFLVCKSNDASLGNAAYDPTPNEDLDTYWAMYQSGAGWSDPDETVAYPATMGDDEATQSWDLGFYITHSNAVSNPPSHAGSPRGVMRGVLRGAA